MKQFEVLFSTVPGSTTIAYHTILTVNHPPVRVPPRRVTNMLDHNIVRVSSSPWLTPAVHVPRSPERLGSALTIELNKQTVKDAYPLPLPDEVQD